MFSLKNVFYFLFCSIFFLISCQNMSSLNNTAFIQKKLEEKKRSCLLKSKNRLASSLHQEEYTFQKTPKTVLDERKFSPRLIKKNFLVEKTEKKSPSSEKSVTIKIDEKSELSIAERETPSSRPQTKSLVPLHKKEKKSSPKKDFLFEKTPEERKILSLAKKISLDSLSKKREKEKKEFVTKKDVLKEEGKSVLSSYDKQEILAETTFDFLNIYEGYQGVYFYDVFVDGEKSGKQKLVIECDGEMTTMRSEIEIRVTFLWLFSFYQKHTCEEVWRNEQLLSLQSWTDNNGEIFELSLESKNGELSGLGPNGKLNKIFITTTNNAWNLSYFLKNKEKTVMLNPQTGEQKSFAALSQGRENLDSTRNKVNCQTWQFQGSEWKFWFNDKGILHKQKDNLLGYPVEIILRKALEKQ